MRREQRWSLLCAGLALVCLGFSPFLSLSFSFLHQEAFNLILPCLLWTRIAGWARYKPRHVSNVFVGRQEEQGEDRADSEMGEPFVQVLLIVGNSVIS